MKAHGKVFKYLDNVDTDVIIPARYLNTTDPTELAAHCMEDIDQDFVHNVKQGDIMVARQNFGCGSSREHAPIGLAILECPEASEKIEAGDEVEVDFDSGLIQNLTKGESYQAEPFPDFIKEIIREGGLLNSIQNK